MEDSDEKENLGEPRPQMSDILDTIFGNIDQRFCTVLFKDKDLLKTIVKVSCLLETLDWVNSFYNDATVGADTLFGNMAQNIVEKIIEIVSEI